MIQGRELAAAVWAAGLVLAACGPGSGAPGEPGRAAAQDPKAVDVELPTGPRPRPRPLPPALREVARAIGQGRFDAAREAAGAYARAHPDDGQAPFLIGLSHYKTGNHGAARPWLERSLELDPSYYVTHDYLAYSLLLLGDLDGAREHYRAFGAVDPREPRAQLGLGMVALEESRLDEAEARFRRALELFELLARDDPAMHRARAPERADCHARLADVAFARDEYPAAREELLTATRLCPENISAFYTLALVHRRLGEDELADAALERYESARKAIVEAAGR
jgi:tetratricopeptide (TPR) repeat protein